METYGDIYKNKPHAARPGAVWLRCADEQGEARVEYASTGAKCEHVSEWEGVPKKFEGKVLKHLFELSLLPSQLFQHQMGSATTEE